MRVLTNFDLATVTTFHIPARASFYCDYDSVDTLRELLFTEPYASMRRLHIGGGSNLLFTETFDGLILHSAVKHIDIIDRQGSSAIVRASAGVVWDDFVKFCVDNSLYGAENLSYIPGEVGASAVQNVGAYGAEAKDIILKVRAIDTTTGRDAEFTADECRFGYRRSLFKQPEAASRYIITEIDFRLSLTPRFNLEYGPLATLKSLPGLSLSDVRDKVIEVRRSKLPEPSELGSAGSFFKNPVVDNADFNRLRGLFPDMPGYPLPCGSLTKLSAAWLIDRAGLKGVSVGGAMVYPLQPLVIVNTGSAKATDVTALRDLVIGSVNQKFGVTLTPEVIIIPPKPSTSTEK